MNIRVEWRQLETGNLDIDKHLTELLEKKPAILEFSKWGGFLPQKYRIELLKTKYFDFDSIDEISSFRLIKN